MAHKKKHWLQSLQNCLTDRSQWSLAHAGKTLWEQWVSTLAERSLANWRSNTSVSQISQERHGKDSKRSKTTAFWKPVSNHVRFWACLSRIGFLNSSELVGFSFFILFFSGLKWACDFWSVDKPRKQNGGRNRTQRQPYWLNAFRFGGGHGEQRLALRDG